MKSRLSIVGALALVVSLAMVLLIMATTVLAYFNLTAIIASSQEKIYAQRAEAVIALLQRRYDRLIQTGMPEVYEDDFKKQAILELEGLFLANSANTKSAPILFSKTGQTIVADGRHAPESLSSIWHELSGVESTGRLSRTINGTWIYAALFRPWGWTLCYAVSEQEKYSDRTAFFLVLLPVMLLITVFFIFVTVVIVKRIIAPIALLTQASNSIAAGDLSVKISTSGIGELALLAHNFASMRDAIQSQMAELKQREERLLQITNNMTDVVYTVDLDLNTIYVSPSVERLLGFTPEEYRKRSPRERYTPESLHIISEILAQEIALESDPSADPNRSRVMEIEEYHRNGSLVTVSNHAKFIRDLSGAPIGFQGVTRDITEIRRVQKEQEKLKERLHQSQKMEAIGQLGGGVAHDFNNALGGIMGIAELLRSQNFSKDEQDEFLGIIITTCTRAADLTRKLLMFSRRESRTNTVVDCVKIVSDTVSLLEHTINKNIFVSMENHAAHTSIAGDDSLLQNAFMNMGINASHAMPNGGRLTFTLKNLELDKEYCEFSPFEIKPGEYLEIAIRDTGCGMPPEVLSRIFEPFFTTKEQGKGTGLGMSAVYGTIQEHNGAITVNSEVGSGTVFRVYLPVIAEKVRSEEQAEPVVTGSGTVLVIDDEELIRFIASSILKSLGYRVIVADNGLEGVNIFREMSGQIDLIILDMIMPGMGGREAFSRLREIRSDIPIIIASGFAKEEDMTELNKLGVNGFLNKPFRKVELAGIVGKSVGRKDTSF